MAITHRLIPEQQRVKHVSDLFGARVFYVESFAFDTASSLCSEYEGGCWDFFELSNGGFYMAPQGDKSYAVVCDNGYEGTLSKGAFGVTVCLYAYSQLSFSPTPEFGEVCARQYHLLREFMLEHPEARQILAAID